MAKLNTFLFKAGFLVSKKKMEQNKKKKERKSMYHLAVLFETMSTSLV